MVFGYKSPLLLIIFVTLTRWNDHTAAPSFLCNGFTIHRTTYTSRFTRVPFKSNTMPHKKYPPIAAAAPLLATRAVLQNNANSDMSEGIAAIDASNVELKGMLDDLRDKDYFRLYSVDILGSCEYLPQEEFECYSESCEIYPVDEDEVPAQIKNVDHDEHDFELDGWARWDMPTEDYYDTVQFPEEYTGYDGADVWNFIHDRICFKEVSDDEEEWKADFNKLVSGVHAMISAQVVRGIQEKIDIGEDLSNEEWIEPKKEFARRLSPDGENPQAMENLYFGYMLILTAVSKVQDRLLRDCESGKIDEDAAKSLRDILDFPLLGDKNIQVASQKLHDHAVKDGDAKGSLWEARMRTREFMRIMNCVQCNKCRLHGKIAVLGVSTAMQIILGRSGDGGDPERVHRVELAAMMTTLGKFSTGVDLCYTMKNEIAS